MAEESGFFTGVAGDRKYTAQFMNEKLYEAMQRKDGIVPKIDQELAVTSDGSLNCVLGTGVAFKLGVIYKNTAPKTFTLDLPASGMKRYDRIAIRIDRLKRTMEAILIKGEEAADPVAPEYSAEDDIHVEKILIDTSGGPYVVTIEDERQMRPLFITGTDSLDDLSEGETFGRISKAKADAINAGQTGLSMRNFFYVNKLSDNFEKVECVLGYDGRLLIGQSGTKQFSHSGDDGITFEQPASITGTSAIRSLAHYMDYFYAGSANDGKIYSSYSPEYSWTLLHTTGLTDDLASIVALSYNVIIAASLTAGRVYKTEDGGTTWSTKNTVTTFYKMISLGGDVLLARGADKKVYRSTDAGSTWTVAASTNFHNETTFFEHLGDGIILEGSNYGVVVHRSADYGFTWDAGTPFEGEERCSALMVDGAKTYFACNNKIYESLDKGLTWNIKWTLPRVGLIKALYKNWNNTIVAVTEYGYIFWGYLFEA